MGVVSEVAADYMIGVRIMHIQDSTLDTDMIFKGMCPFDHFGGNFWLSTGRDRANIDCDIDSFRSKFLQLA